MPGKWIDSDVSIQNGWTQCNTYNGILVTAALEDLNIKKYAVKTGFGLSGLVDLYKTSIGLTMKTIFCKNSIRDARTPQPGEVVFNTMRYRSRETVQRSGYFQSSVSYKKVQMMFI